MQAELRPAHAQQPADQLKRAAETAILWSKCVVTGITFVLVVTVDIWGTSLSLFGKMCFCFSVALQYLILWPPVQR